MTESGEVVDRLDHHSALVVPNRRQGAAFERPADDDGTADRGGRARRCEGRRRAGRPRARRRPGARPTSAGRRRSPPACPSRAGCVSAIERAASSDSTPEMNSMKNGSSASVRAGSSEHEPAGVCARGREGARGTVRVPAEVVGDGEDALARIVRHPGTSVERVRHGALRHTGPLGDVLDRDPRAASLHHSTASFERNAIRRSMLFIG